jgi:hypothetical protein
MSSARKTQLFFIICVAGASCNDAPAPIYSRGSIDTAGPIDRRPPRQMLGPFWAPDSTWVADSIARSLSHSGSPKPIVIETCLSRPGSVFIVQEAASLVAFWVPVNLDHLQHTLQRLPLRPKPGSIPRDSLMLHAARAFEPDSTRQPLQLISECVTRHGITFYFGGNPPVLHWDLVMWTNGYDALRLE